MQGKRLTEEELAQTLRDVRNYAPHGAKLLEAHIAALTPPTPEDVARDTATVKDGLALNVDAQAYARIYEPAFKRLATAAAREIGRAHV